MFKKFFFILITISLLIGYILLNYTLSWIYNNYLAYSNFHANLLETIVFCLAIIYLYVIHTYVVIPNKTEEKTSYLVFRHCVVMIWVCMGGNLAQAAFDIYDDKMVEPLWLYFKKNFWFFLLIYISCFLSHHWRENISKTFELKI